MRHPRLLSAGLLAIGVVAGTMTDQQRPRVVPRSGEYWILAGDFHVHAGPGDGMLLPWELRREARRAGLDVFAITNHNMTFAARLGHAWARYFGGPPPILIAGQEITHPDYHVIGVGLTSTVEWRQPAASAIDAVHRQGGVAIAAHPGRDYWGGYDEKALAMLDGAEAANPAGEDEEQDYAEFLRRARQVNPGIAAIGSSDFHGMPALGRARTYLFARERSEAGVLEAIREGRTVAADERGNLYGDPELVRLVETNRPTGRSQENDAWRRFSITVAWLGALGLMIFGRRAQ